MNKINEYLSQKADAPHYVYLSGLLDEHLYHIAYLPDGTGAKLFVLLDSGADIEVQSDKIGSYFIYKGKTYRFLNGPELAYAPGVVNYPTTRAYKMVVDGVRPDKEALYADLKSLIEEYYDFYCPEELLIAVIGVLQSYLIVSIGSTFYLFFEGPPNTGKSSLQKVLAQLQYNGCFIGKTTVPALARKVHSYQATLNIDEFDKLSFEERDRTIGVLNHGFYKGGTYELTNMNAKKTSDQIQIIQTFSTKTFSANRIHLDPSLATRCVPINTVRSKRRTKNINALSDSELERFVELRDRIFAYMLMAGKEVLSDIEAAKERYAESNIFARSADISSIITGIDVHFGGDGTLANFLAEKNSFETEEISENDRTYLIYCFLLDKAKNAGTAVDEITFTNSDLVDYINDELGYDDGEEPFGKVSRYKATSSSVGSLLKFNKIVSKRAEKRRLTSGAHKGRWEYIISKEKILDLLRRCIYEDLVQSTQDLDDYLNLGKTGGDVPMPF